MDDAQRDRREAGFKDRTRLADARDRLREAVSPHRRTETLPLGDADGRVLAAAVAAHRDVPHYRRAAMDGYAVRAADTFGASDRSPAVLGLAADSDDGTEEGAERGADDTGVGGDGSDGDAAVAPGEAVRVHTGSPVPDGADAVVMVEHADAVAGDLEVFDAVAEGENVAPVGEDVAAGTALFEPGHRLRPSDLGLLKSVGVREVTVADRPEVGVVPTGEELVDADPDPGEVVETNGLTVSRYVRRWGGRARYRDVVTDDREALRAAVERDLDADAVVTTGGSSVGERDLLPEVLADRGEVLVHGVALRPGHPVALGVVEDTPVLALPGYPVACIVNAVQFLRPTVAWLAGAAPPPHARVRATLDRKVPSEPGVRTFARVALERAGDEGEDERADDDVDLNDDGVAYRATPTRASGAGVLSSVALADGWVVVPEESEGIPAGETVTVEDWEPQG